MSDEETSRTGRDKQRYNDKGQRLVVGCIPYRYNEKHELEVLLVSSPKSSNSFMFPKGGWENDETIEHAASRESKEEAGAVGILQDSLGTWTYNSKSSDAQHLGTVFPLLVTNLLDKWSEKNQRTRKWVSVKDAKKYCKQEWMQEAFDKYFYRLSGRTLD